MTVINAVVGATSPGTAEIIAKVTNGPVSVDVSQFDTMTSSDTFGPVTVDAEGVAQIPITGLTANTKYFYQVLDNGVVDENIGSFRTHPPLGQPADFTIAAASCAGASPAVTGEGAVLAPTRLSNHSVFTEITNRDPLMFIHMGDLHYYDLGAEPSSVAPGTLANYRRSYDDVLLQPNQAELYRSIALAYVWDDHDFGPNNSDGTLVTKENAQIAYRERVPHYPLPGSSGDDTGAIYQSWQIGRILFIASDVRSERSPNDDPDGPDKTMLGDAQKSWMRGVLESSDAEFLCWITPSVWHHVPGAIDTWKQFPDEQDEMVSMFTETGWIDRMLAVWGDRHALGIDDGSGSPGGIPSFQYAGLDSTPSGVVPGLFSTGDASTSRGQWGTLRFRDTGSAIEVTGEGYAGSSVIRSLTFQIQVSEPPPGEQPPPFASAATLRTSVTWIACNLVSGKIITELPEVRGDNIGRVLGAYTSSTIQIPIPRSGPGRLSLDSVLQASDPRWRVMIVAVVNDIPMWAGIVSHRLGGTEAELNLGCVSPEGYFQHRYVSDHTWTQRDEASVIMTGLLEDAGEIAGVGAGIGLTIDAPSTGTLRDRTYVDDDNATVYDRMRELMGVINGPEFTVDIDWTDTTQTTVAKIARVRKRIGIASTTPHAVFSSTARNEAVYELNEDCTGDRYANRVLAYSSGEGEDQPRSSFAHSTSELVAGVPIIEKRFEPGSSISTKSVLDSHAQAELERVRDGAQTWEISARWDKYPRYGIDWMIGDDVGYRLIGHRHPRPGIISQDRVIGFELDMGSQIIKPILLNTEEE